MSTGLARREFMLVTAAMTAASGLPIESAQAQSSDPTQPSASGYQAPKGERFLRIGNLIELEQEAAKIIPPGAFAYIASGADSEWTLHENRRAFDRHALRPHYLVGKPAPDLRTRAARARAQPSNHHRADGRARSGACVSGGRYREGNR